MEETKQEFAQQITSVEGITEYRLENGTQVLLMPDASKSKVTVNMTVFVGSRHEGYGEAGMAHLLEHMLFKGTPTHPNIPELLSNRGARFNGTTWVDRTNYYETLPAHTPELALENLELAIRLESDRMVNSTISAEDLRSEMDVVCNEFERGENNPRRVLYQRVYSAAFDWHNYGKSTIGNRSDIELVPVEKLREFYKQYYRPDNIMVVVAGKFEQHKALELLDKHFGSIPPPSASLEKTYTTEPPQDGERLVTLRRVGNTQHLMAAYHTPAGAHEDFAALEMLAYIFGIEPSGRLYQALVVPEYASSVATSSMALHDPGIISFSCQVPASKPLDQAEHTFVQCIESVAEVPITQDELNRAKAQFAKYRDLRASKTVQLAIELTEWAAQGDWRLYFLFRDRIENVTAKDCTRAAQKYLARNNRTLGRFVPTEDSQRVEIPAKPNLIQLLDGYQGRDDVVAGEEFDPSPLAIEERLQKETLSCGLKASWLPKKSRGNALSIVLHLRFGNEQHLTPFQGAMDLLPQMLMRGTESYDYQQLQDRLAELRSTVRTSGFNGLLHLFVETQTNYLSEVLKLVEEILRKPRFASEELDVLKRQTIATMEANMTEPNSLAPLAVRRALAPFPKSNIRYVPTLEERIEQIEAVTTEQLQSLYDLINASHGEATAVGEFESNELSKKLDHIFADWQANVPYERIAMDAQIEIPGCIATLETPDKNNAVYFANMHFEDARRPS